MKTDHDLARVCRQQAAVTTDVKTRDALLEMARDYEAMVAAADRQPLIRRPTDL